ncbi:Cation-independent mannose-6-phosphate receptor [Plecturocebus cupreus]
MGAAAGRSSHLGPAPARRPQRSLLLLQLLLLVAAPGATQSQTAPFPELCRIMENPAFIYLFIFKLW